MNKRKLYLYHLAGWLIYFCYTETGSYFFPTTPFGVQHPDRVAMLGLSYALSLAAVFYYCYLFILPGFINKKSRALYIIGIVAIPLIFIITRYFLEEVVYPAAFGFANYGKGNPIQHYILDNTFRCLPVVAISTAIWSLLRIYEREKENKMLKEEKTNAELAFLKSQINPHFLYNTLNYIYSLAYPVSDKLADAVLKLSQLMRYMLQESTDGKVDLQKEIDYLDSYITLYRLRFEDLFFVSFFHEVHDSSLRIASLVMIPFVENAFKHGIVNDPRQPVKINLNVTNEKLTFVVTNTINQNQKDHSGGVGLNNIRRRLELIYPGKHELLISENGQTYETMLIINFN